MYVEREIEARSCNYISRKIGKRITYFSVSFTLRYPQHNAHAPYFIVVWFLYDSTIFFHII